MALESLILDARGNPFQGSIDGITGEVFTDARAATVVLSSGAAEALIDLQGKAVVVFDIRSAASVLTYIIEQTFDGNNYVAVAPFAITQALGATVVQDEYVPHTITTATTHTAVYMVTATGARRLRIRITAFTSGAITVAERSSSANFLIANRPIPSTKHATGTAAANTAVTLTLAAPGIGLFHHITNIHLTRNATALLAGTGTLVTTSTNLPGNPAWSVGNAMVAGGSQLDLNYSPTTPLKSLVANTATTIVMPAAGAAVLNRANASYYVGP